MAARSSGEKVLNEARVRKPFRKTTPRSHHDMFGYLSEISIKKIGAEFCSTVSYPLDCSGSMYVASLTGAMLLDMVDCDLFVDWCQCLFLEDLPGHTIKRIYLFVYRLTTVYIFCSGDEDTLMVRSIRLHAGT